MMQVSEYNSKLSSLGVQVLSRCLKITEKVSFNIASEATSELRIHFEWTKVDYNAKNCPFWRVFENLKLAVKQSYQTGQF